MTEQRFTLAGIIIVAIVLWVYGINGSKEVQRTINGFLFVLLSSIVIIRWNKISPLILKSGNAIPDDVQTGGTRV